MPHGWADKKRECVEFLFPYTFQLLSIVMRLIGGWWSEYTHGEVFIKEKHSLAFTLDQT